MKAIVCLKYGAPEVLQMTEVEKPVPKKNEVLIKIFATTVNGADTRIRGAVFPSVFNFPVKMAMGFKGPRKNILGVELAGEIESIGENVSRFKQGDQIFASTGASFGAYAEYICLSEKAVMTIKPSNMTFEEAAAVPHCALAALHFLKKGDIQKGSKVLIHGASGGIGTFAVQLAKSMEAEVTGVCSTSNLDLVKSIGADKVIDYIKDDLPKKGDNYDVIFDTVGKGPIISHINALKEKGIYLSAVHLELPRIIKGLKTSLTSSKKVIGGSAPYTAENLELLKNLIETGKLKTVIDKKYTFDQIVEAHRYVDAGHKKGHVTVSVTDKNE
ncbi:zinc-binding dehydrogenase [Maribellus comscasis]|uniref:Zinc-binding dehydrogenase n=1 Tax=Maribellus comscasis TaxID=2681766 RepID=A0A6I6JM84_9BACT|nr:NAD(P)-dependent alcohol dehydrogenase [Maribellus comscasis]QGY43996.1 zinc-binding dehydrogenase [Maribellus comscasis]